MVDSKDRRTQLLQLGAGAAFLALAAVVVLIVLSASSSGGGDAKNVVGVAAVEKLLSGVPQHGLTLGDPKAPVELVEYGDLQCSTCKAYSEDLLPTIIEGPVRQGQAKITFQNYRIISEESVPAGAAALAAGGQGRGWSYIELFYRNQGAEASGYVTDEFMTAIADGAGVEDIPLWNRERGSPALKAEVEATTKEAEDVFGFTGTPSFAIKGPSTNGLESIGTPQSGGEFKDAIDQAS